MTRDITRAVLSFSAGGLAVISVRYGIWFLLAGVTIMAITIPQWRMWYRR